MNGQSLLDEVFTEASNPYTNTSGFFPNEFEVIGKKDSRVRVKNTLLDPFRYLCHIQFDTGLSKRPRGTGILVGPSTVLTAGHVIWNRPGNVVLDKTKIIVVPARNGNNPPPFGEFKVTEIFFSKAGFGNADHVTANDYAIIHLDKPAGNTAGYWGKGIWAKDKIGSSFLKTNFLPLPAGTLKVNVCGYPGDKHPLADPLFRSQWVDYNLSSKFTSSRKLLAYKNDTKKGQSGGAVWVRRSPDMGGRVLVGIHIGCKECKNDNLAVFVDDTVRNFIITNTI